MRFALTAFALAAATVATIVLLVVIDNHNFAIRQQRITNCQTTYHYSQAHCARLYPNK